MKKNKLFRANIILIGIIFWVTACAHYPLNAPLTSYDAAKGYRYPSPSETEAEDALFIALAFSGGGTRAAALSYGVLRKLAEIKIPTNNDQTLLDEVDVISSVSGGSFTAAYYGLFGNRIFNDFEDRFLFRNIQGELAKGLFKPSNWVRLPSPNFSRIDMAAEIYHEMIFDRQTYQKLIDNDRRPYIALNATNMTTGERFTFTQQQFDLIGSDLSKYPIARAVAASSAFPFLLSPISLGNHPAAEGYDLPTDMKLALDPESARVNMRRYLWAQNRADYHQHKADHPYLHLMDGGLADNLGLRYLMDNYRRTSGFLWPRKSKIEHLVVIVVNAKTNSPENIDTKESPPGLKKVAFKTATVSMDNYTFETVEMTKELIKESEKAVRNIAACQKLVDKFCGDGNQIPKLGHSFRAYVIEINFLNIKDPDIRNKMLSLPTNFSLKKGQVRNLIQVGGELLEESKQFKTLMKNLAQQ